MWALTAKKGRPNFSHRWSKPEGSHVKHRGRRGEKGTLVGSAIEADVPEVQSSSYTKDKRGNPCALCRVLLMCPGRVRRFPDPPDQRIQSDSTGDKCQREEACVSSAVCRLLATMWNQLQRMGSFGLRVSGSSI